MNNLESLKKNLFIMLDECVMLYKEIQLMQYGLYKNVIRI